MRQAIKGLKGNIRFAPRCCQSLLNLDNRRISTIRTSGPFYGTFTVCTSPLDQAVLIGPFQKPFQEPKEHLLNLKLVCALVAVPQWGGDVFVTGKPDLGTTVVYFCCANKLIKIMKINANEITFLNC